MVAKGGSGDVWFNGSCQGWPLLLMAVVRCHSAVMVAAPVMVEVTAAKERIERISYISDILIQLLNLTC